MLTMSFASQLFIYGCLVSEAPPAQKLGASNFPCPAWHVQRVATEDSEPTMVLSTFKIPVQVQQVQTVKVADVKFKTK